MDIYWRSIRLEGYVSSNIMPSVPYRRATNSSRLSNKAIRTLHISSSSKKIIPYLSPPRPSPLPSSTPPYLTELLSLPTYSSILQTGRVHRETLHEKLGPRASAYGTTRAKGTHPTRQVRVHNSHHRPRTTSRPRDRLTGSDHIEQRAILLYIPLPSLD